ncbi:hypothetical protein HYE67_000186 [Fusarium culmorum]|uniref:Secreted protein n=1 Tax=Fusarium culmorum TaxID=5516 RepID=A0A7S8HR89_FUSCU|nr:hypothetical protein HYE67_000186 [Fusarium culmorum]
MQILNIAAISVFIASSLAADCYGTEGIASRFIEGYWDARQKMCSNTECAYQQPCTVTTWKKYTAIGSTTIKIEISRKNTAGKAGFKDCWVCMLYKMINTRDLTDRYAGCYGVRIQFSSKDDDLTFTGT